MGGESSNDNGKYRYRPCELEWMEYLVEVRTKTQMPVFVKQLGTPLSKDLDLSHRHAHDMSEFPKYPRIQDFPESIPREILDRIG